MHDVYNRSDLAIVIVTYNSEATLRYTLESLRDWDVVVVDNNSSDSSRDIAEQFSNVRVLPQDRNLGYGAACNVGMAAYPLRDILLLNPDVVCDPAAPAKLHSVLHESGAGIVVPRLFFPDGRPQVSTRPFPSLVELARGQLNPAGRQVADFGTPVIPVDWALGAAMLLDRALINRCGGFDPRYFLYFEDVDLCARCWAAGRSVLQTRDVQMTHRHARASRRIAAFWLKPVRHHWRSLLRFIRKHPKLALRPNSRPVRSKMTSNDSE